jgi:hypothetical protein
VLRRRIHGAAQGKRRETSGFQGIPVRYVHKIVEQMYDRFFMRGVSKTFGEWYQKTKQKIQTN